MRAFARGWRGNACCGRITQGCVRRGGKNARLGARRGDGLAAEKGAVSSLVNIPRNVGMLGGGNGRRGVRKVGQEMGTDGGLMQNDEQAAVGLSRAQRRVGW